MSEKSKWSGYAESGLQFTVEGRQLALTGSLLRFRNSSLKFVPPTGTTLDKPVRETGNVEVVGRFEERNGRLMFRVDRLKAVPTDEDEFRIRRLQIRGNDARSLYDLSEWAAGRAEYYDDEDLLKKAQTLSREGVEIERRALKDHDADGLFALAKKAEKLKLPAEIRQELVHEGWRIRWDNLRKKETEIDGLLESLAKELPGAMKPLNPPQPRLRGKYLTAPKTAYREADAGERKKLHRIFYTEVLIPQIQAKLKSDGSNGGTVADEIDMQVPELHALAETYRERELSHLTSRIESSTREEVVRLSERLRKSNQPERSRKALEKWLDARTAELRKTDGAAGLSKAADEYLNLLEDDEAAAGLLIEAHHLNPESEQIATRLNRLGYRLHNDRWLPESKLRSIPVDPLKKAMQEGRAAVGMTAEQVRRTLGGPVRVTRVATSGRVNEIWDYRRPGLTGPVVHLLRSARESALEATVKSVAYPDEG